MPGRDLYDHYVTKAFKQLFAEYSDIDKHTEISQRESSHKRDTALLIDHESEKQAVDNFLTKGCGCKNNCHKLFTTEELLKARAKVRSYSWDEKNYYLLGQLYSFLRYSDLSISGRTQTKRKQQTFEYRINMDRPVCRDAFLFYYGETIKRLKRIQKHLFSNGLQTPVHGNTGRMPSHTYDQADREKVILFIINLAANHGLPDPGRDLRKGKGRLRILLPSVMNYTSVHELYVKSINLSGKNAVGYDTFMQIWQSQLSYIVFNNPKTDLTLGILLNNYNTHSKINK